MHCRSLACVRSQGMVHATMPRDQGFVQSYSQNTHDAFFVITCAAISEKQPDEYYTSTMRKTRKWRDNWYMERGKHISVVDLAAFSPYLRGEKL